MIAAAEAVAGITAGGTLLGALGIAIVTIHTTKLRLGAEGERQRHELNHDRELVDIADLRQLLDEAATALDRAEAARLPAEDDILIVGDDGPHEARREIAWRSAGRLRPVMPPLVALTARLRVRLGPDDPITASFVKATQGLAMMCDGLQDPKCNSVEVVKRYGREFIDGSTGFFAAAVGRAGTFTRDHADS